MKAAEAIVETMIEAGIKYIFGLPDNPPLYQALYDRQDKIKHILVRHEEGAAFMSYGYSVVTGNVGVCEASKAPGACHLVNGIAEANSDYVPVIALTAATSSSDRYRNESHLMDQMALFESITKWNAELINSNMAARVIQDAIRISTCAPAGAVHIDLLLDKLNEENDYKILKPEAYIPSDRSLGNEEAVKKAAKLLIDAEGPAMLIGWGAILSDAAPEVLELAELLGIPVATAEKGKGIIPEDHPLATGVWIVDSIRGWKPAETILSRADVILAVGTEFIAPAGYFERLIKPDAKLINININPARIAYEHPVEVGIVGDAKAVLGQIIKSCKDFLRGSKKVLLGDLPIVHELDKLREEWWKELMPKTTSNAVPIKPQRVMKEIQDILVAPFNKIGRNTIISNGGGKHMVFAYQIMSAYEPRAWIHCLHHDTIGAGLGQALGAKVAVQDVLKENRYVVDIDGDGSFNMSLTEMGTAMQWGIPVIVCLFDNESFGWVRDEQVLLYRGKILGSEFKNPDFVTLARAFGWYGQRVEEPDAIEGALRNAMKANDKGQAALIDFAVDKEEHSI